MHLEVQSTPALARIIRRNHRPPFYGIIHPLLVTICDLLSIRRKPSNV